MLESGSGMRPTKCLTYISHSRDWEWGQLASILYSPSLCWRSWSLPSQHWWSWAVCSRAGSSRGRQADPSCTSHLDTAGQTLTLSRPLDSSPLESLPSSSSSLNRTVYVWLTLPSLSTRCCMFGCVLKNIPALQWFLLVHPVSLQLEQYPAVRVSIGWQTAWQN